MITTNFYYKKGPIEVFHPWKKPNDTTFLLWKTDFLNTVIKKKYQAYLCGGFLEKKWDTPDIDIIISGPLHFLTIEKILIEGHALGFYKYRILFDIQFSNDCPLWPYTTATKVVKYKLGPQTAFNNNILEDLRNNSSYYQRSKYLWEINSVCPTDKQQNRIKNGYYYDTKPLLLTL